MTPVLQVAAIQKSFAAVPVLRQIDLEVGAGEALGLIGPNGAGKTTLFNIMSGFVTPDAGEVRLQGRDITQMTPESRARLGVVRTFQKSLVFPTMSVRRNVAMAVRAAQSTGYRWWRAALALRQADEQAQALVEAGGLASRADMLAANLSYGEQRTLDLLIALAQRPRLLLLDEPTAGLSEAESHRLLELITTHHADIALVLVSHDIDVVFRVCSRIAVMDLGVLIANDTPQAIRADARVIAAYLGMPARLIAGAGS